MEYETIVGSLEEALALAKQWQREGKFDLFRGQSRNWKLLASIHRNKHQNDHDLCLERVETLFFFMKNNEILKSYIHDFHHFIAIAQHYGLATSYIDFTTDPYVAAYFATHSGNRPGEYACIICANKEDFKDTIAFGKPVFNKYLKNGHQPAFLSFDVKNLWRLQAQKGHFLYTPFPGIERIYPFDRILFPFTEPFDGLKTEDIYPTSKSILESHLDHFFTTERRNNNMKKIIAWLGEDKVRRLPGQNIFDYIDDKCKPHYSWRLKNTIQWRKHFEEHWDHLENKKVLEFQFSYTRIRNWEVDTLAEHVEQVLSGYSSYRSTIIKLLVKRIHIPFNKKLNNQIQKGCNLIWNGMRNLPYTDREIAIALSQFVIMMCDDHTYSDDDYKPLMGQAIKISLSNDNMSHSRAYAGGFNILSAKRKNIYRYIKSEEREICQDNPVALTQLISDPRYLFTFGGFRKLFVSDVIPSQTILAITQENPVIYFNPVQIKIFGLA
ncbi:FRG domain-containing protein [Chitinophaga barathri]|uniref:FRG domain-containing protein n=1 Tax=Chitinophaga barathri TaxID=1647451 RepID=A0A3N4MA70_9BACT|nr:FRG domain-containing protein [Chitinophaga barathri]RPD38267.1 FRG domain-containing protein [Chitinophaga barathri]